MSTVSEIINSLIVGVQNDITTNGNNEITGQVLRERLIAILSGLSELLSEPSDYILNQYPNYDPLAIYEGGQEIIVRHNGKLWLFVSDTDRTGIAPGTLGVVWREFGLLELAHAANTDKKLAEFTSNEVSAAEIRAFIDSFDASGDIVLNEYSTEAEGGVLEYTIPNRPIVAFLINGIKYNNQHYTLTLPTGDTQTLTWGEAFPLDENDELTIIYSGVAVII